MNEIGEKRLTKITEDLLKYQEEYNTRQAKFEEEFGEEVMTDEAFKKHCE